MVVEGHALEAERANLNDKADGAQMCEKLKDDDDRAEPLMPSPRAFARCDFIPRGPILRRKPLYSICKIGKLW